MEVEAIFKLLSLALWHGLCKTQHITVTIGVNFLGLRIQAQDVHQRLLMLFDGAELAVFPHSHRPP